MPAQTTRGSFPAMNPLAPLARMKAGIMRARAAEQQKRKQALIAAMRATAARRKAGQGEAVTEEKKGMSVVAKAGIGASILAVLAGIIGVKYLVK